MSLRPSFGQHLNMLFKDRGLSQYRVSNETEIPQPTINKICLDQRSLSPENAYILGKYLGITAESLLNIQREYITRELKSNEEFQERLANITPYDYDQVTIG